MKRTTELMLANKILSRATLTERGCLEYRVRVNRGGYPAVQVWNGLKYANKTASRIIFGAIVRPITREEIVLHKCDNTLCINPAHLFTGTIRDNVLDMIKKGRKVIVYGEAAKHKLSTAQVKEIRASSCSYKKITEKYGIAKSTVSAIKNYKSRIYG